MQRCVSSWTSDAQIELHLLPIEHTYKLHAVIWYTALGCHRYCIEYLQLHWSVFQTLSLQSLNLPSPALGLYTVSHTRTIVCSRAFSFAIRKQGTIFNSQFLTYHQLSLLNDYLKTNLFNNYYSSNNRYCFLFYHFYRTLALTFCVVKHWWPIHFGISAIIISL